LATTRGDQQARAELLGKLLQAAGQNPYMLRHGTGRAGYHLILLKLKQEAREALAQASGAPIPGVRVGGMTFVALPLEKDARAGQVPAQRYNAETGTWTATIAISRFR
jgi:hypothetical protein